MIKPYDDEDSKGEQIRRMFNRIAPAYDRLNSLMSWGLDEHWRSKAVSLLLPYAPQRILDVATGTGDMAIRMMRSIPELQAVVGVDIAEQMMVYAREKVRAVGFEEQISFVKASGEDLPFEEASFDACTIAFGLRNFEHISLGLREMYKVLRPGAPLLILELARPEKVPARWGYELYTRSLLPRLGQSLSGDKQAYTYLPASIAAVPQRQALVDMLDVVGFSQAYCRPLSLGVAAIYVAIK